MRLLNLTVENIGLYSGIHRFDLTPGSVAEGQRNIVLFRGHNGAGKSTLFQCLPLALYGSLTLGDRTSQNVYNEYLLGRLHRKTDEGKTVTSCTGHVAVTFEYVQSGLPLRVRVERHWQRNGRVVQEHLSLFQDGNVVALNPADYQGWLNDLIPPGVSPLFFFDAERLDALASPDQHNERLAETLKRLLGLDLVERLQSDLDYYTSRRGGVDRLDQLRIENPKLQAAIDELDAQLLTLQEETAAQTAYEEQCEAALADQERRLIAEGGAYAERRPLLQDRLVTVQKDKEAVEGQLREMISLLLPFALCPELCQSLALRLKHEAELHRQQIAADVWQQKMAALENTIHSGALWENVTLQEDAQSTLAQRFVALLRAETSPNEEDKRRVVHHLAEPEHERLQGWITQALHAVPKQLQIVSDRLRELQAEQRQIEEDLRRAPSDDILVPIHAEILRLQTALSEAERRLAQLAEQKGSLQYQREALARQVQEAHKQITFTESMERQLVLAERSKMVLRAYQDALTRQQLAALETRLTASFNRICQKERLLSAAFIHPENFRIQLQGVEEHVLNLADFSAGERQLYALALLQALREVSGRRMPLLIDTPLARLDDAHRTRLLYAYFPEVSEQVLLFATDVELDTNVLAQIQPYVARTYGLQYNPHQEQTEVVCTEMVPNIFSVQE